MAEDPYITLGVSPTASDAELRAAYRRLVQLHHPDHNHGSLEAARRFEAVQEAYARVRELRAGGNRTSGTRRPPRSSTSTPPPRTAPRPAPDPELDSRLADLERELRQAQAARQRAEQAAREAARAAAADAQQRRPGLASDEELGYVNTDDSFSKILADARQEVAERFSEVRGSPEAKRAADLIDELGAVLRGERRDKSG
jgi:curved DNA-binding protein CbpA